MQETDPSYGKLLADQLDSALRSRHLGEAETETGLIDDLASGKKILFCATFLTNYSSNKLDGSLPIYYQAEELKAEFNSWRDTSAVCKCSVCRMDDEIKKSITLSDLYTCADIEAEAFGNLMRNYPIGSNPYDYFRALADQWSRIEEITEAALDV